MLLLSLVPESLCWSRLSAHFFFNFVSGHLGAYVLEEGVEGLGYCIYARVNVVCVHTEKVAYFMTH